jgi:hypothetical protein
VDEERRSYDIPDDAIDDLDRMLGRSELEIPRPRSVGTGQLDRDAIEPDDEDLRLDGAIDVPTDRLPRHVTRRGLAVAG